MHHRYSASDTAAKRNMPASLCKDRHRMRSTAESFFAPLVWRVFLVSWFWIHSFQPCLHYIRCATSQSIGMTHCHTTSEVGNSNITKTASCCGKQLQDDDTCHLKCATCCVINTQFTTTKTKEEKKLVRKINWTLMPFICFLIGLQVRQHSMISKVLTFWYSLLIKQYFLLLLFLAFMKTLALHMINSAGWVLFFMADSL